jgi:signal peptidase II
VTALPPHSPIAHKPLPPGRFWPLALLLFATLVSDQLSKYVARRVLEDAGPIAFLQGTVTFSLVENRLGFLGIVHDLPAFFQFFFLNICVGAVLFGCLVMLCRLARHNSPYTLPLGFVTGGGLSNLLDRLFGEGGVTDFMMVGIGRLQTGVFNVADVCILFGSFALGFQLFRHTAKPEQGSAADH